MSLQNQWVGYLDRSYKSIKASILTRMETLVPEITDHSESNIFVIIISLFAGLTEQLNYYIDNVARESFFSTARRYSSLLKLARFIDYRVKANVSATVDLKIIAVDGSGDPFPVTSDVLILAGTIAEDSAGLQFVTQNNITIFVGNTYAVVGARQREMSTNQNLGTTTANPNQVFDLIEEYEDGTLQITIDYETWELRDTFAFSGPLDKHFIVELDENRLAWVVFGDGVNGAIPPTGQIVWGTFYETKGINGNVEADTITAWVSGKPTGGGATDFEITNLLIAAGGIDAEGIEEVRKHAPLSLRTLDRAVTLQDHADIALLVPGVGKAAVIFNDQTKLITVYVAPDGGGIASSELLQTVEDFFEDKKMISTFIEAMTAGETKLRIKLTVMAKFRRDITDTENDIKTALSEAFGFNNSDVNKDIRKSDIIALIDNLDKVEYLSLDYLTTKPYPRILIGTNPLENNWRIEVTDDSIEIVTWRLAIIDPANGGDGSAYLYRTGPSGIEAFDGSVTIHTTDPSATDYTSLDGSLKIAVWGTGFSVANAWTFKTYPHNENLEFEDYTIPVYDEDELDLTVTEQLIV